MVIHDDYLSADEPASQVAEAIVQIACSLTNVDYIATSDKKIIEIKEKIMKLRKDFAVSFPKCKNLMKKDKASLF